MRVVSLAPSATSIIERIGLGDTLVATSDHSPAYPDVGGWLTPNLDRIEEFDPDIVVTTDALQDHIAEQLRGDYETLHYEPTTLTGIAHHISDLGSALNEPERGIAGANRFRRALQEEAYQPVSKRPLLYAEEWDNPPMAAGNWVPEIVRLAGGRYPFVQGGERSHPITKETFEKAAPDIAVIHLCGRGTETVPSLRDRGWTAPAVENDDIVVVNDDYLNRPSFEVINGLRRLRRVVEMWETR